jgi:glycosyltransferase involved in cell wall biosynthesis
MKILYFIESLRAGGKERRIVELLKGFKKYPELEIELVLTRKEIHYDEIYDLNVPIHIIERKFLKKDPLLFYKFYRIASKFRPDVIHVWGHMVAVYAIPTIKILGIPLINNEITDATPNQKLLGKATVFKNSNRIIANTQAGLDAYNAPVEKSGVIYNGFNFTRLNSLESPQEIRSRFGITTPYVIAMVATFSPYKDYGTYVRSALNVLNKRNDVTFLCAGDKDDTEFKAMVPAELKKNILFLGKQNKVEAIMNACDLGVLMTNVNNHAEGISNALMEFMALGKPVMATNYGGSVELIVNQKTGYLINPFDAEQLAEKINHLLDNEADRKSMGEAARQRVHDKFSIETMIRSFYEEYQKVLTVTTAKR